MRRERAQTWAMLAPFLAGLLVLVVVPAAFTFGLSLFHYDLLTPPDFRFFGNFADLLHDRRFERALENSLVFVAVAVPLRLLGALGLALLLHANLRGARFHRTVAYLPTVVPDAAYALLWLYVLNPLYGPLNVLIGGIGFHEPAWLTSSSSAMAALVLMSAFTIGEGFIVALAARQELPSELYEAARVEGSSPWHTLRRLTLPLMAPTLVLLAARDVAFSLQATFVPALLVTGGGPNGATTFLPQLIYDNAFDGLRYGYAAAMTLSMFVITLLVVYVQYRIISRRRFGFRL